MLMTSNIYFLARKYVETTFLHFMYPHDVSCYKKNVEEVRTKAGANQASIKVKYKCLRVKNSIA